MRATLILLTAACASAAPSIAQESSGGRAAVGAIAAQTVTATVEAIDMETREVALRTAAGDAIVLVAGADARNLGQVEVGDLVRAEYQVGIVIGLGPPGVEARLQETEVLRAPQGGRPGGIVRATTAVTATIVAIDAQARTVRLQGPERTIELPVAADVDLASVRVGDRVGALFEESLAILVEPVGTGE